MQCVGIAFYESKITQGRSFDNYTTKPKHGGCLDSEPGLPAESLSLGPIRFSRNTREVCQVPLFSPCLMCAIARALLCVYVYTKR